MGQNYLVLPCAVRTKPVKLWFIEKETPRSSLVIKSVHIGVGNPDLNWNLPCNRVSDVLFRNQWLDAFSHGFDQRGFVLFAFARTHYTPKRIGDELKYAMCHMRARAQIINAAVNFGRGRVSAVSHAIFNSAIFKANVFDTEIRPLRDSQRFISDAALLSNSAPLESRQERIDDADNKQTDLHFDRWRGVGFWFGACLCPLSFGLMLYGAKGVEERSLRGLQDRKLFLYFVLLGAVGKFCGGFLTLIGPRLF